MYVYEDVQPVIDPQAIADKVKSELDKMLRLGVIVEETESTPFCNDCAKTSENPSLSRPY